jgi:hypothetical protein
VSNPDLHPTATLGLVATLQKVTGAFARQEESLSREIAARRIAIQRQHRDAISKTEERLAELIETSNAQSQTSRQHIAALYSDRRTRVNRAAATALRKLPLRARQHKERWMGDLQLRQFQSERKLETDQKTADQTLAEFNARLAEAQARVTLLRQRARRAFAGYFSFRRLLRPRGGTAPMPHSREDALRDLLTLIANAEHEFAQFCQRPLPKFFRTALPIVVFPLLIAVAVVFALVLPAPTSVLAAGALGLIIILLAVLHFMGFQQGKPGATTLTNTLALAHVQHTAAAAAAQAQHEQEFARAQQEYEATRTAILQQWNRSEDVEADFERTQREKIEKQLPRITAKIDQYSRPKLARTVTDRDEHQALYRQNAEARTHEYDETRSTANTALNEEESSRWATLAAEWQTAITPLFQRINALQATAAEFFPPWSDAFLDSWSAAEAFTPLTQFAHLDVSLTTRPHDPRLPLPGPEELSLPLALSYPKEGSILFETSESATTAIIGTLNNIILRLFTTSPPGKVAFTVIDPVGLGQNFAGLMHFSDYEEALINRRIWTQRDQIEERLGELSEHIEKVIQMYLRNEYESITQYNEQAGSVAEKYLFLVVADFPSGFSETAARRLQSIATSGARCGVFTLIHWDKRQEMPDGFVPDELRKSSLVLTRAGTELVVENAPAEAAAKITFDRPPPDELAAKFVHKIGKASVDSNRVEVPFSQIAPARDQMWTNETTSEVKIAIGRTGATKHQFLAIGKGTRQHALFAGKTGSGKSTLFHVIITNLALACSPEQIEFYLIDFKKGVEFKCYAEKRLPHARVVAIESDREFALSVLQRVDEELKRRGDMFRKLGVQDVAGYKRDGGTEPMPRVLLIIDEFQEFFVDDDTIAQTASLLFDRIVRQGRAFGIHVLLGSQTLGGAYSLARATLGQMVIRVALQCNEADAYLIMDDNNPAPRLLSRPGEGIYNDAAGAIEGNSPFQVVWLSDNERDERLDDIHVLAEQRHIQVASPIVFEGNAPAALSENDLLRRALETVPLTAPPVARTWLGAPNSIKGPTEAAFQRQSGNNLLLVGQRDEVALTILGISLLSFAAQFPLNSAKFVLIQSTTPGSTDAEFLDRVVAAVPHPVTVSRGPEIPQIIAELNAEMKARSIGEAPADAPAIFVLIHGLHRFKKLRQEDDFSFSMSGDDSGANPGAQFNELITEGSSYGIHLLVSIDTLNNVNRSMSRKALTEFEMRVVFQMSGNDSASLIDSPKASTLGLHRALFYNEQAGSLETFRPYAAPDSTWLANAATQLDRLKQVRSTPVEASTNPPTSP